jgi:uncharacterized protein YxeA
MKFNTLSVVLSVIIIALAAFILFRKHSADDVDRYVKQKYQIDSLNNVVNTLETNQLVQDSVIKNYQTQVVKLDRDIDAAKYKITNLKHEYSTKIQTVSVYTPNELDKFFADRYKQ